MPGLPCLSGTDSGEGLDWRETELFPTLSTHTSQGCSRENFRCEARLPVFLLVSHWCGLVRVSRLTRTKHSIIRDGNSSSMVSHTMASLGPLSTEMAWLSIESTPPIRINDIWLTSGFIHNNMGHGMSKDQAGSIAWQLNIRHQKVQGPTVRHHLLDWCHFKLSLDKLSMFPLWPLYIHPRSSLPMRCLYRHLCTSVNFINNASYKDLCHGRYGCVAPNHYSQYLKRIVSRVLCPSLWHSAINSMINTWKR